MTVVNISFIYMLRLVSQAPVFLDPTAIHLQRALNCYDAQIYILLTTPCGCEDSAPTVDFTSCMTNFHSREECHVLYQQYPLLLILPSK